MGSPENIPEFPHYDAFDTPDITRRPIRIEFNCNWFQVLDAINDPEYRPDVPTLHQYADDRALYRL